MDDYVYSGVPLERILGYDRAISSGVATNVYKTRRLDCVYRSEKVLSEARSVHPPK